MAGTDRLAEWNSPVIVFDGVCVLCTANARFVLKHDKKGHFRLASMQGTAGAELMQAAGVDPSDPETLIVTDGTSVLRNSDAIIAIWTELGWPWKVAVLLKLIPLFMRDAVYGFIARNRYRIFGKLDECWVPTPEQAKRIL